MRASADDEIRAALGLRREKLRNLARQMLPIGIERDDGVESMLERIRESGLERRALAAVDGVRHDLRARRPRDLCRPIHRSVVDHDNVLIHRFAVANDVPDTSLGIQGRNEREHFHARSFEITAQTMPPPAEVEVTRMVRSFAGRDSRTGMKRISVSASSKPNDACN